MKKLLQAIILLPVFLNATGFAEDSTEGAERVFNSFFHSFTNGDSEGVIGLFADDTLFWGTGSKTLVKDIEGIRSYFSGLSNYSPGQRTASALDLSILSLSENQAMVSGTWKVVREGISEARVLRISALVANLSAEWKIIQFHNSGVPE